MNYLPQNIRYLRDNSECKQDKLANALGISRMALSNYERGRTDVSTDVLIKIAHYFQISIDDLLTTDLESGDSVQNGALDHAPIKTPTPKGKHTTNPPNMTQVALKHETELLKARIAALQTEITMLREINDLLKAPK